MAKCEDGGMVSSTWRPWAQGRLQGEWLQVEIGSDTLLAWSRMVCAHGHHPKPNPCVCSQPVLG